MGIRTQKKFWSKEEAKRDYIVFPILYKLNLEVILMKKKGFLNGLYPTTKLLMACTIALSAILFDNVIYSYGCFFICAVIAANCGVIKEYIKYGLASIGILAFFILIMQMFFYPGEGVIWSLGFLKLTEEGINFGLKMSSRIVAIGSSFVMFFRITDIKDFIFSLEKMGISSKASYIVLSTIQMVPLMKKQSEVIMDAQRSRGVETEGSIKNRVKAFLPVIGPLVISSIASTEERALTLQARGFSVKTKRTSLKNLEKSNSDKIMMALMILIILIIVAWRIRLWLL